MKVNLRDIPSVSKLMEHPMGKELIKEYGHKEFVSNCRNVLENTRSNPQYVINLEIETILAKIKSEIDKQDQYRLKRVINATGTILHTNLGRAPMSEKVGELMKDISTGYSNLEFDLQKGERGSRTKGIAQQMSTILGVDDCVIVNNNAAAVLLVLMCITKGKQVIISRGQLVEIGGSFRVPEIMEQSGSILKEIGTTNKVHLRDYENAICENTGAILRVHPSNYRIVGFTEEVPLDKLSVLAQNNNLPLIDDLGSGTIVNLQNWGVEDEPTVNQSLKQGADIVTFSGDKLLGGPQCGIIVGKKEYIQKIKKHPMMRALRCDKLVLAALQNTLDLYKKDFINDIPLYQFLARETSNLFEMADEITKHLPNNKFQILEDYSYVGGGALPTHKLSTVIIKFKGEYSAAKLAKQFRNQKTPIIGRVNQDHYILDLKAVFKSDIPYIRQVTKKIWGEING